MPPSDKYAFRCLPPSSFPCIKETRRRWLIPFSEVSPAKVARRWYTDPPGSATAIPICHCLLAQPSSVQARVPISVDGIWMILFVSFGSGCSRSKAPCPCLVLSKGKGRKSSARRPSSYRDSIVGRGRATWPAPRGQSMQQQGGVLLAAALVRQAMHLSVGSSQAGVQRICSGLTARTAACLSHRRRPSSVVRTR